MKSGKPELLQIAPKAKSYFTDRNDTRFLQIIRSQTLPSDADITIVGIPFDGAILGRQGARFAPNAIRKALKYHSTYSPEFALDLRKLVIADLGNVRVLNREILESHERIEKVMRSVYENAKTVAMLGGDHSLTFPIVKALARVMDARIGIIAFDSHFDVRDPREVGVSSGTSFRRILESLSNRVYGSNLVEIGSHGFQNSLVYANYVKRRGVRIFPISEFRRLGVKQLVSQALAIASAGASAIHLSVDMDCIDQGFAPGVSAPSSGGLLPHELLNSVFEIAKHPIVRSIDIVETSPPLDVADCTVNLASTVLVYFAAGIAARKKA